MNLPAPAFAFLLLASSAQAGTEISIETRKAGAAAGARPQQSLVAVEGRSLAAEAGDGRHALLYRGEEGVLQILDHVEKSVVSIDRASALAVSRGVGSAREEVRGRLDGLPAAQREAVERLLGPDAPPARIELRATGRGERVSGIACELLEATRDGTRLAEICEGPQGALGVTAAALAPARELAALLAEVGALLPSSMSGEGLDALALVERVKGVPLRVRSWPEGRPAMESRIVRATPKRFGPERFRPPPDYHAGLGVHVRE